jgi:hypothetical protein
VTKPRIGILASEVPPEHKTGVSKAVLDLLPTLRLQSGTWFRVGEFPDSPQAALNCAGYLKTHKRAKGYEFTTRKIDGGSVLWARHVKRASETLRSVS